MKARISEKELFRRFGGDVVVLHGCDSAMALMGSPDWYNCGVYGWNFDAWAIDGKCVILGDRWVRRFRELDYSFCRKWDELAREINRDYKNYDARRAKFRSDFAAAIREA